MLHYIYLEISFPVTIKFHLNTTFISLNVIEYKTDSLYLRHDIKIHRTIYNIMQTTTEVFSLAIINIVIVKTR